MGIVHGRRSFVILGSDGEGFRWGCRYRTIVVSHGEICGSDPRRGHDSGGQVITSTGYTHARVMFLILHYSSRFGKL
jgi:hypothetical protein